MWFMVLAAVWLIALGVGYWRDPDSVPTLLSLRSTTHTGARRIEAAAHVLLGDFILVLAMWDLFLDLTTASVSSSTVASFAPPA